MCNISAPPSLDLNILSYTWIRNGTILARETSSQLDLSLLPLSENNTVYTCEYTATSMYLNNNMDVTSPGHTIRITSM